MKSLLICDLDGTLVDSFPGIAAALLQACAAVGIVVRSAPDRSMVGPPLDELLRSVAGPIDGATLALLRQAFVAAYDEEACRLSVPFAGVAEMLDAVQSGGHALALATNKRLTPTRVILETLGWCDRFDPVETIDSRPGSQREKQQMLLDIVRDRSLDGTTAIYVGDTLADVRAAKATRIPCILAAWGYANPGIRDAQFCASTPQDVVELLSQGSLWE